MPKFNFKPDAKDYYERLGLQKNADYSQIRKAYKFFTMKFHPDRNPSNPKEAEENFKKCKEAYDVLIDSKKRDIYDQYGEEGLKRGAGGAGFNPFGGGGLFSDIFGGGFGGRGRGDYDEGPKKTPSVKRGLEVTLEDLYCGKVRKIRVTRKRICKTCNGKGSSKPGAVQKCSKCGGVGQVQQIVQHGPGFISKQITTCPKCHGEGEMINPKYRCKKCNGEKTIEEKKTLEVHIDKGMRAGQKITFDGECDEKPGYDKAGDIIFVLQEKPHKIYKREGTNLIIKKKINLAESLTGVEFTIKTLDNRILHVKSKPGEVIKHGSQKQITGEGFPTYRNPYQKGNLIIKFDVEFPNSIPLEFVDKLIKVLPPKQKVNLNQFEDQEIEECQLSNIDKSSNSHGHNRREAYDDDGDDDEHGHGGEQHMTCNIQ